MMRRISAILALVLLLTTTGAPVALAATVNVSTGSFYFEDATVGDGKITAKVGDQLRFVIEDGGKGTPHTVEIPALGISSGPLATKSSYVTAVITKPGTFELFCKPHANKGHKTTLVVTGEAPTPTAGTTTTTATTTTTTSGSGSVTSTTGVPTTTLPGASPTVTAGGAPDSDSARDTSATGPDTSGTIPVGVSGPSTPGWTGIIPMAVLGLVPLAGIAVYAGTRKHDRPD